MERTRYIISDLHIGAGNPLDSFDEDRSFKCFLEAIGRRPGSELIINGDFMDFISVILEDETARQLSRMGCTEEESLRKLERVIEAHPTVFSALRKYLDKKGHRLVLLPGNHDIDMFWPGVRDRLREVIGGPDDERFHFEESGIYRDDGLYVEHGNQYFADTVFEKYTEPFLRDPRSGEMRLERCWANCFLPYFLTGRTGERLPFFNNVMPAYEMILMCLQEEAWWFRLVYLLKLLRFKSKVGTPPFDEGRSALLEKRNTGDEEAGPVSDRRIGFASGMDQMDEQELVDTMQWEHGFPSQDEAEELDDRPIPLDPLAARENTLMMAARELLVTDEETSVVVFGHEHQYFSNELDPEVAGRKGKYYINTGTWIPMLFLTRTRRQLRWDDLRDQSLYQHLLTYGVINSAQGSDRANLKCLAQV